VRFERIIACKRQRFHTSVTFFDLGETRETHAEARGVNTANSPVGIRSNKFTSRSTAAPRPLKNRVGDIGENKMGCQGRKKRVLSKGEKNARRARQSSWHPKSMALPVARKK
jgi:hypothetical protein